MAWVLFDLNGTLLDPRPVGEPLGVEDGGQLALSALDDAVAQAMADTLAGDFREFPGYLEAALRRRLAVAGASDDGVDAAMKAAQQMPPFEDAAEALDLLAEAGLRVGVLTNSSTDSARGALDAAGLAARLHAIMGVDRFGVYKPDGRVYRGAVAELDGSPAETWLVAAHWWDVRGAKAAGLRTAWVSRKEGELLATVPEPDVRADTLAHAARAIADRAGG